MHSDRGIGTCLGDGACFQDNYGVRLNGVAVR